MLDEFQSLKMQIFLIYIDNNSGYFKNKFNFNHGKMIMAEYMEPH